MTKNSFVAEINFKLAGSEKKNFFSDISMSGNNGRSRGNSVKKSNVRRSDCIRSF